MDFYSCFPLKGQFPTTTGLFMLNYTTCSFFTSIAYHLNTHIMLDMSYVIAFDIWEVRIMS